MGNAKQSIMEFRNIGDTNWSENFYNLSSRLGKVGVKGFRQLLAFIVQLAWELPRYL